MLNHLENLDDQHVHHNAVYTNDQQTAQTDRDSFPIPHSHGSRVTVDATVRSVFFGERPKLQAWSSLADRGCNRAAGR